jgi:UDP:flavonoid glycosyltransferase YjiC (YdhE family)
VARILFTWELGGGMGHVAPYLSLANGLREKGHEVAFILRDLRLAETSLGQYDFPYFQAPVILRKAENEIPTPYTFAQILHNVGYGNIQLLTGLAKGWRQIFETYRPDLIIYDHSPTALLASRDMACKKVITGNGFFIPPDITPLPLLRTNPVPDMAAVVADEARILANINQVLHRFGAKPVDRITQLYHADDKILMSFRELDHYQARQQEDVVYWGTSPSGLGSVPIWPVSQGKRIYAYLKPFKALEPLLHYLQQLQASVIIYAPDLNEAIKQRYSSPTLYFSRSPLDLEQVASSCDIAITHSTHATVATFLLAGKPLLLLPIYLEQAILAYNIERMGAGLKAAPYRPQEIIIKLQLLLDDPRFTHAAGYFAKQYADFDAGNMGQRLINRIDSLLLPA